MNRATVHGPAAIDNWTVDFEGTPICGDVVRIDGVAYKIIRREWRTSISTLTLHLTLEHV